MNSINTVETSTADSSEDEDTKAWKLEVRKKLDHAIEEAEKAVESTPAEQQEISLLQTASELYEKRFEDGGAKCTEDLEKAILAQQKIAQRCSASDGEVSLTAKTLIACLQFKGGNINALKIILEIPFLELPRSPVSLQDVPPHRYRFLDCRAFVAQTALRILDLETLPKGRYTALSYVWRGLKNENVVSALDQYIAVKGAESADPIALTVLRTACLASLYLKCERLWLDRLCIMQDNKSDKSWQIKNMYQIYKSCRACLVLPGGIMRLASLGEETSWIQRAWTLQEVVAPPRVECLVAWPWDDGIVLQSNFPVTFVRIEPGKSGMASLLNLLQGSTKSSLNIISRKSMEGNNSKNSFGDQEINVLVKSSGSKAHIGALMRALKKDHKALQANAIWRSGLMRTSSRPVDMVFSIMGLLGAPLEPSSFEKNDRHRATIELVRTLLSKGEPAHWLAISLDLDSNPLMSTMPIMPESRVDGNAFLRTADGLQEVSSLVETSWWWLEDAPRGTMDQYGYFRFKAKAAPVEDSISSPPTEYVGNEAETKTKIRGKTLQKIVNSQWKYKWTLKPQALIDTTFEKCSSFALVVGKWEPYLDGCCSMINNPKETIVMIVKKHGHKNGIMLAMD